MRKRAVARSGAVSALLLVAVAGCAAVPGGSMGSTAAPTFAPPAAVVEAAVTPTEFHLQADAAWLASIGSATGIPERALQAYASAALVSGREDPECAIGWNTLAGIGWVESRHGVIFDGTIEADGTALPHIFGVSLDGDGVALIPDSDGGEIDGDASVDRAVGPMQFIPGTWRSWRVDAGGDGDEDPHNIDDASLAAAHYLCRAGGDLATEDGWRAGVLAYNRSESYAADVARAAVGYADDAASAAD